MHSWEPVKPEQRQQLGAMPAAFSVQQPNLHLFFFFFLKLLLTSPRPPSRGQCWARDHGRGGEIRLVLPTGSVRAEQEAVGAGHGGHRMQWVQDVVGAGHGGHSMWWVQYVVGIEGGGCRRWWAQDAVGAGGGGLRTRSAQKAVGTGCGGRRRRWAQEVVGLGGGGHRRRWAQAVGRGCSAPAAAGTPLPAPPVPGAQPAAGGGLPPPPQCPLEGALCPRLRRRCSRAALGAAAGGEKNK